MTLLKHNVCLILHSAEKSSTCLVLLTVGNYKMPWCWASGDVVAARTIVLGVTSVFPVCKTLRTLLIKALNWC